MMPRLGSALIHSRVLFPFPKERERSRKEESRSQPMKDSVGCSGSRLPYRINYRFGDSQSSFCINGSFEVNYGW